MSDKFQIDFHKLNYHPHRVAEWLDKGDIYPLYIEASPSGTCNHKCRFCAVDFMGYQKRFLDVPKFKRSLTEMSIIGVKSIQYAGEGEPLLHPRIADIVEHARNVGIDVGITSNGVLFTPELAEELLPNSKWIKISFNAGEARTYSKIHRCKESDYGTVLANLVSACKIKGHCTMGMQIVLLPENQAEIVKLAQLARDIGLDYLVVKPHSQHPLSKTKRYENINYESQLSLAKELERFNTKGFSVIFRTTAMEKWDAKSRPYDDCCALPFWSYIDSGANLWACSVYLTDEKWCYGNLYEDTFNTIWKGKKRQEHLEYVQTKHDISQCRIGCRMDECNRYLYRLKNPQEHDRFI